MASHIDLLIIDQQLAFHRLQHWAGDKAYTNVNNVLECIHTNLSTFAKKWDASIRLKTLYSYVGQRGYLVHAQLQFPNSKKLGVFKLKHNEQSKFQRSIDNYKWLERALTQNEEAFTEIIELIDNRAEGL